MPYLSISSLILVLFTLFPKESTCVDDSVIREMGIAADVYGLYETDISDSVTKISIPSVVKRIHTTTRHSADTSTVPPDIWVCASSTILSSTDGAAMPSLLSLAVKFSVPAELDTYAVELDRIPLPPS